MLEIKDILSVIEAINNSNIDEFKLEHGSTKLKIQKNNNQSSKKNFAEIHSNHKEEVIEEPATIVKPIKIEEKITEEVVKEAVSTMKTETIVSPMVGTFYISPSPDMPPYVKLGDKVNKESTVCIVEAMKLFNEIQSEVDGEIVEILVTNGQLVEYGQVLFKVKTN